MRPGWPGHRSRGRHARGARTLAGHTIWVVSAAMAIICGVVVMTPTGGAVRLAARMADAVGSPPLQAPAAPPTLADGRSFNGTPAVGALFTVSGGQLRRHFCTASVVDSPAGDLVITAAHCVGGMAPGQIAFVPGYRSGAAPYGVWLTSAALSDSAWQASSDPDHDVAFLVVHRTGSSDRIQDLTGGEQLGIGWPARVWVDVIGYPDATERPITCENESKPLGASEMEFDCGGYTDGTSGGPFLGRVDPSTGDGTVIGVIGGYEQGGNIASVSYSPGFGRAVQALYQAAIARG
jgi:V8-like Glu-specific endopeptidase